MDFARAREVVRHGVRQRAFPAAVAEIGSREKVFWREAFGTLTYEPDSPSTRKETLFDLASLTKVIVTTTVAMRLVEQGRLHLNDPIQRWLPEWRGRDRDHVQVQALLEHCSGLTAWLPFYRDHSGRHEFQHAICTLPLEYAPSSQSVYSDLGFILLGFILETAGGASFERLGAALLGQLTSSPLIFNPPIVIRGNIAPTERDPWRGRLLIGEVHDENAWALGGAAGHAGLFGAAAAVGEFARTMLASLGGTAVDVQRLAGREILETFLTPTSVPNSSRALGWDTMRPTSSCGTRMSASAFGHTGFTGTSLWIDPSLDAYFVLLTNRVYGSRDNETIREVRPAFHDAAVESLCGGGL